MRTDVTTVIAVDPPLPCVGVFAVTGVVEVGVEVVVVVGAIDDADDGESSPASECPTL